MKRALFLACAAALALAAPAVSQEKARFDLTFKPVRVGDEVAAIEVVSTLTGVAGKPLRLQAPVVYAGVTGIADRVEGLAARDASGEVALTSTDDKAAPGGFPYFRHWTSSRPINGPVTISYRSKVQPPAQVRGPPFNIRPSGGGVSGGGMGFIVMPEGVGPATAHTHWDFSAMPAGSFGVASYGEGDQTLSDLGRLWQSWYLAGPAKRYPPAGGQDHGFSAAWLGRAPFDAEAEMKWADELYGFLGKQFRYLNPPPPYRVFMRFLETPPVGGGTALAGSFMLSGPAGDPKPDGHGPRGTLAHEMIHQWSGFVDAPQGVSSWFSEGLTTYYAALMPKRGGYASVEDSNREINAMARGYWGSPARNWSAEKIAESGFGDENIRHIPYNRSALLFAEIDSRIRAKSKGKRRLEDALQPIFIGREKGVKFDHAAWQAFLTKELGKDAADQWKRVVLDGESFVPGEHAFGPCLVRKPTTFTYDGKTYDGFEWVPVPGVAAAKCKAW